MASLLDFTRENNFLVKIKTNFSLNTKLLILLKSLFKWVPEVSNFCTMEKRYVLSAKSLALVDRPSDRSLM